MWMSKSNCLHKVKGTNVNSLMLMHARQIEPSFRLYKTNHDYHLIKFVLNKASVCSFGLAWPDLVCLCLTLWIKLQWHRRNTDTKYCSINVCECKRGRETDTICNRAKSSAPTTITSHLEENIRMKEMKMIFVQIWQYIVSCFILVWHRAQYNKANGKLAREIMCVGVWIT